MKRKPVLRLVPKNVKLDDAVLNRQDAESDVSHCLTLQFIQFIQFIRSHPFTSVHIRSHPFTSVHSVYPFVGSFGPYILRHVLKATRRLKASRMVPAAIAPKGRSFATQPRFR